MRSSKIKSFSLIVLSLMLMFLMSVSASAAAFKVTNYNVAKPSKITIGYPFKISGKISANATIKSVTVAIYNSTGKTCKQKYTATPNAKSYNLADADSHLHFENLAAGTYYYRITAKNSKGSSVKALNKKFTVVSPKLTIKKFNITHPDKLALGSNFKPEGSIQTNIKVASIVFNILNSSGKKSLQRYEAPIMGKYFNFSTVEGKLDFSKLSAGSYYYRASVYDLSKKKTTVISKKFTVQKPVTSSIKITDPKPAKTFTFAQGTAYGIGGTITSANNLTSVKADIIDSAKKVLYSKIVNPGTTSYKLAGSPLDTAMCFEKLQPGVYTFAVSAIDSAGKTAVLINRTFFVTAKESKIWLDKNYSICPSEDVTISRGYSYSIVGLIRSNRRITNVTGTLTNATGSTVYSKAVAPNTTSFQLSGSAIDNAILFNKLSAGTYYLNVLVKDDLNSVVPVMSRKIVVK